MKSWMLRTLGLGVALAALLGVGAGTASAAQPDVSQCKDGGYVHYVDPATGASFANQGRCVSTVARGGTLVPVTPPIAQSGGWQFQPADQAKCNAVATFTGSAGVTYPVTWVDSTGLVLATYDRTAGADGSFAVDLLAPPTRTDVLDLLTVTVGDKTFAVPPVTCLTVTATYTPAPAFPGQCSVTVWITHIPSGFATSFELFLNGTLSGGVDNVFPSSTREAGIGAILPAGAAFSVKGGDEEYGIGIDQTYDFGTITC